MCWPVAYWTTRVNLAAWLRLVEPEAKFAVTVRVYVPGCVPELPPLPSTGPPPHETNVVPRHTKAAIANIEVQLKRVCRHPNNNTMNTSRRTARRMAGIGIGCLRLILRLLMNRSTVPRDPVVVTVTVAIAADEPFTEIWFGETEQVDVAGAPLQVRDTLWANPPAGAMPTV